MMTLFSLSSLAWFCLCCLSDEISSDKDTEEQCTIYSGTSEDLPCGVNKESATKRYDLSLLLNPDYINIDSIPLDKMNELIDNMNSKGYFLIKNYLLDDAVLMLKNKLLNDYGNKRVDKERTCELDYGVTDKLSSNYDEFHPRNELLKSSVTMITRSLFKQDDYIYNTLYMHTLNILKNVTYLNLTNKIYPSHSLNGSIYAYFMENNDFGDWHFDKHPLSCVYLLNKANNGGVFEMYYFNNDNKQRDWYIIDQLFERRHQRQDKNRLSNKIKNKKNKNKDSADEEDEEEMKLRENAKNKVAENLVLLTDYSPGDVYCFWGNRTMHRITPVVGEIPRLTLITTYSTSIRNPMQEAQRELFYY